MSKQTIEQLRRERGEAEERFKDDPHRPRYHFLPPANWMNDPNGPIFFNGRYHLFYQHNPAEARWGDIHWGHAVSEDLLHWEDWPIALEPRTTGVDQNGCFTGCAFIRDDGTPTIAYAGITPADGLPRGRRESQSLAMSRDGMLTWEKSPQNPVITEPPEGLDVVGFRDPCVWRDGHAWYMLIGSGIRDQGGAALLYRSTDLMAWDYLGPLATGDLDSHGEMWECPDFFSLGDRHLLLVSTLGRQMYLSGDWADEEFVPRTEGLADFSPAFYAGKSFECPQGRRILWGWLREARSTQAQLDAGWSGVMSLPRVLSILPDGRLSCEPAEELRQLRGQSISYAGIDLNAGDQRELELTGDCVEIEATISMEPAARFAIAVRCSPDREERTEVFFDNHASALGIDSTRSSQDPAAETRVSSGPLTLLPDEPLHLRVFVDRSVVEVFANDRACVTERIYPTRSDSNRICVDITGGDGTFQRLTAWTMRDVWRGG